VAQNLHYAPPALPARPCVHPVRHGHWGLRHSRCGVLDQPDPQRGRRHHSGIRTRGPRPRCLRPLGPRPQVVVDRRAQRAHATSALVAHIGPKLGNWGKTPKAAPIADRVRRMTHRRRACVHTLDVMVWTVKCTACSLRNSSEGWGDLIVLSRKSCARCGQPLDATINRPGSLSVRRCSFVIRPNVVCRRVTPEGSDVCAEHVAVVEEDRQRNERASEELRARLGKPPATQQLVARLEASSRRRLPDERELAAERTRRWMDERAEERRLDGTPSARLGARKLQEQRRLEAAIARRRWKQKAASRKQSYPGGSSPT
jgi:hypothetical protein